MVETSGFELQPDVVFVDDDRFEVQADAILFPNES
jgi:hypothetical protein